MKATYEDGIQMDTLLLCARAILAEAEQVAAGRQVRITLYGKTDSMSFVVPLRVAVYASRVIGQPVAVGEAGKVVFFTQGVATVWRCSALGWECLILVFAARLTAERKRLVRQVAQLRKGGATR